MHFGTIPMGKHSSFAKPNKTCNITRWGGGQEAEGFFVLPTFSSPKGRNYQRALNFLEWKQTVHQTGCTSEFWTDNICIGLISQGFNI